MSGQKDLERLLSEFRDKGGGTRNTTLRLLGRKLDRHGAPFHKEHVEFDDAAEGPRSIDVVETGTCSFGHAVDDKVRVAGVCEIGGEVLCSTPGCLLQCDRCGAVVCRKHGKTYGERTYCRRCRWVYYWRSFWRLD